MGSQKENGRDTSSQVHCTLCQGPSLYLSSQPCLWKCLLLAQGQLRESSPLWVGGGAIINERLIKAYCCHIPGHLSHLPNNIHHSFTQPLHILVAGRVPVTQEELYNLQCHPPPTPKHDKAESPTEAVPGTHSFFPLPAFSLLPPALLKLEKIPARCSRQGRLCRSSCGFLRAFSKASSPHPSSQVRSEARKGYLHGVLHGVVSSLGSSDKLRAEWPPQKDLTCFVKDGTFLKLVDFPAPAQCYSTHIDILVQS